MTTALEIFQKQLQENKITLDEKNTDEAFAVCIFNKVEVDLIHASLLREDRISSLGISTESETVDEQV